MISRNSNDCNDRGIVGENHNNSDGDCYRD